MDHIGIVKNAVRTTLRYRALWVLGFLWALVGGGGVWSSGAPNSSGTGYQFGSEEIPFLQDFDPAAIGGILAAIASVLVFLCCLFLILGIIATVVRYVLQAGVFRSLADLELQGTAPTVRGGFRQGWHRRTWRLFGQNLLVGIVLFLVIFLLAAVVAAPLLLLFADSSALKGIGVASTIGLGMLWLLFVIVVATVVGVLQQFWWRAAVIGDEDWLGAIKTGWRLVRSNLGDVAVMWLLMLGIGIAWLFLMFMLMLGLFAIFALVGIGPGILFYQMTEGFALAVLWGVTVGFIIFVLPLLIVSGLYLIFHTSVWNQVYNRLTSPAELDLA